MKNLTRAFLSIILFVCAMQTSGFSQFKLHKGDQPIIVEDSEINNRYHVYIAKEYSGDTTFFATIDDIYIDHHHHVEYKEHRLFVIIRNTDQLGYFQGTELWLYYHADSKKLLYKTKGSIEFSAYITGEYLAIYDASTDHIIVDELEGDYDNEFFTYSFTDIRGEPVPSENLQLLSWSDSTHRIFFIRLATYHLGDRSGE